ncbi:unnamed protein product [Nippostrongylus brasiliensis]|uniref:Uncharacterized protein n=1 Tax=Nippostrongylus brasiliensis TaxID=27835 RepID=A0A0N4YRT4_NIPBR|nr:unnamed protein product [Nippostrongylus brasiliensis]
MSCFLLARTLYRHFRILLVVLLCAYYYACVVGIMKLRTVITIEKLSLPDSYLHSFQSQFEESLKNMQPISVFVLNPGDLRDPQRLASKFLPIE